MYIVLFNLIFIEYVLNKILSLYFKNYKKYIGVVILKDNIISFIVEL